MFDLILHGGTLVGPDNRNKADVAIKDEKIVLIGADLSNEKASEILSLDGLFVLPGCIDSHMHLWESGFATRPDFRDGTLASISGGITTIIDHPLTIPEVLNKNILEEKKELGNRTSYLDFALHGGVGLHNHDQLFELWDSGCTAFKIFMCESGSAVAGLRDGDLLNALKIIGSFGGTAIFHAENEDMLQYNKKQLENNQRIDNKAFLDWRPPIVEYEAINRILFLMQDTGAKVIILHTTIPEGVNLISQSREKGLDVWVETCPHNLYLTDEHLINLGPWVTYSPPVRDINRVNGLWDQLATNKIHIVGSDHGPVEKELKVMGENNIWKGQYGIPGAETVVSLMLNAVVDERITLERLVSVLSEMPARLYGLYPRKGCINVGSDADFTIVDLSKTHTLNASEMNTSCGWIPYEGWNLNGKVEYSIIRGQIVLRQGELLVNPGFGKFIGRIDKIKN